MNGAVAALSPKAGIVGAAGAAPMRAVLVSCLASSEVFAPRAEPPPPNAKAGAAGAVSALSAALEGAPAKEKLAAGTDDALVPELAVPNEKLDEPVRIQQSIRSRSKSGFS